MGGRVVLVLMGIALAVIGGGIVLMVRMGSDSVAGPMEAGAAEAAAKQKKAPYADNPLTPTATFNVSQRLESGINVIPEMAAVADRLHAVDTEAVDDLYAVEELIRFHSRMFNSVPGGGENVDIMRHMTGGNERRVALIPPDHAALNDKGELIDRWGTPFHFHPVSRRKMDVRSAGPDLKLWTSDDVMIEGGEESETPIEPEVDSGAEEPAEEA